MEIYSTIKGYNTENEKQRKFIRELNKAIKRKEKKEYPIKLKVEIVGCGIYKTEIDDENRCPEMEEAIEKAERETGYSPEWQIIEPPENEEEEKRGQPIEKEKGWYNKQLEKAGTDPESIKKKIPKHPEPGEENTAGAIYWANREKEVEKQAAEHRKMFAELLINRNTREEKNHD